MMKETFIIEEKENKSENDADSTSEYSKRTLIKNLIVISLSWTFLFIGFFSISNLQSSLNSDANLGTLSLSSIYVALIVASTFFPKLLNRFFGLKWTIVISQFAYLIYIAANLYPTWLTLMPGILNRFYTHYNSKIIYVYMFSGLNPKS